MATDCPENITIQVIYAEPGAVWRRTLCVPSGTTAAGALESCEFARQHPNYPLDSLAVGVFGQICPVERCLADGDRLEIYRPLTFDAIESRRRRAIHRQAFMTKPKNRPKRRKAKLAAAALAALGKS